ncbi:LysR family transcriptional regulator [Variovorax beijingensis]|uniref:LysR family transcriptional regulator n=1 Tax=Variovorax beijingensis TaxID=2496117 RepID=A0A3P3EER8_9BURK|nr:LysR family transcriptional regulator [Variovorax beijingensis]RRH83688.1 LysR family transcriptional regulator [Variovorax beijingensis]
MFQLSQIRCFVVVANELHFGRAAARLHMTQPPLSRQIQQLEAALGVPLLERNQRNVRLTPAGKAFLPEATYLLEASQTAASVARRAASGEAGSISLGYVAGASFVLLPRIVAAARAQLPGLDVVLRDMSSVEQYEALLSGRLDVGIVRAPADRADLRSASVVREPFVAAVPVGHPLAARRKLAMADLHGQDLVMYEPGQGGSMYELLTAAFHAAHVAPRYVQYVRQTYCVMGLVSSGIGIALVQASAAGLRVPGVVARPIALPPDTVSEMHLAWRAADEKTNPAVERFRRLVLAFQ